MAENLSIKKITVNAGQTVPDIAIQEYGIIEGVTLVLEANPGLNITDDLTPGQELIIWGQVTIELIKELVSSPAYATQVQGLLMQWSSLISTTIINNSPTNVLDIPRLHLSKSNGVLYAKWNSFNTKFLDYNPQIRLFRWSRNSKIVSHIGNIKPDYFLRPNGTRWRMMTRFMNDEQRAIQFTCPLVSNQDIAVPINLDDWIDTLYDDVETTKVIRMSMSRKSRGQLKIYVDTLSGQSNEISVGFALGIVISNPSGQRPYLIWDSLTPFRIAVQRYCADDEVIPNVFALRKFIRLR